MRAQEATRGCGVANTREATLDWELETERLAAYDRGLVRPFRPGLADLGVDILAETAGQLPLGRWKVTRMAQWSVMCVQRGCVEG